MKICKPRPYNGRGKSNLYNSSGGALLFAIITAFLISFTGATLAMLTTNQYKIIDDEIKRKESYYLLRAGVEFVNSQLNQGMYRDLAIGSTRSITLPTELSSRNVIITIERLNPADPSNFSDFEIDARVT